MTKISKLKILFLLSIFYFLFSVNLVEAAQLNFISQIQEISINQQFQVDLILDTENEEINAVEGEIIFPKDLLELKEIRDGNSIINFWIEKPRVEQPGTIVFSGIIPGGYQETKGFLFSVIFQAKASGDDAIEIRDAKVLLNDGEGTPASVKLSPFQFLISQEVPSAPLMVETVKDTDSPEDFKPEIAQYPEMFDGKYFLVFATQDKGSGIDHYEVLENRKQKIEKRRWVDGESPYVLKDQGLRSFVYVKAVDKAGNERIVVIEPRYPMKWYENWWIWGIIILGVFVLYICGKILWQKFIKSR